MDSWRADFNLFRSMIDKVSCKAVLKGRGDQEDRTYFKKEILDAMPMCQKTNQQGRPAWLNPALVGTQEVAMAFGRGSGLS